MCKRPTYPFEIVGRGGGEIDRQPAERLGAPVYEFIDGALVKKHLPLASVEEVAKIAAEIANDPPRPLDCSGGDRPRVILSDTTAILMAEAFYEKANAGGVKAQTLEGSENITRAFAELDLLQKALEADGVVV